MGGFSVEWLALREAADHRARDPGLLKRLAAWAASRDSLTVLDLGCGTGSNAKAMIPHLPATQHWRLVDNDRALLEAARESLAEEGAHKLSAMSVKIEEADLALSVAPLLARDCDLVTAAALFDLVSTEWLDGLVDALAEHRLPLYTVLVYDGAMAWEPAHAADEAVRLAFNAHQQRDKGFGPAAGPAAVPHLAMRFTEAGFDVITAPSPWHLGSDDHAVLSATASGIVKAVRETGRLTEAELADWLALRRQGGRCTLGHLDLLALPRS